jgi:hypothetical protein
MNTMTVSRDEAARDALASVRLEGLEPSETTVALLEAWGRGDIDDQELAAAKAQMIADATASGRRARRNSA